MRRTLPACCAPPRAATIMHLNQAVTAVLLYKGVTLPMVDGVLREAWSHVDTPRLFVEQLELLVRDRDRRNDMARRLSGLYKARVAADYSARVTLTTVQLDGLRRDAGYVIKTVERILLDGLSRTSR